MTRDPALVHALQELADDSLTILLVEDLRRLADELMQHATAMALLDAQALGVPADAAVDAVKNQFPEVRLMVAGHASEQNVLATRISQQKVFRFVHKPASPQRLRLFVDAAAARNPEAGPAAATGTQPALAAGAAQPPRGGSSPLPIIAGVAAVLALAVGGWMMMRKDEAPTSAPAAAVSAPPVVSPELTALLERADRAFAAGSYIAADGSSAAELYREASRLDAGNEAAKDGFERSIEGALTGAEKALLDGKLDQARVTAELLRLIVPDNSRLAFLYTQIERELARVNADATQRQALEARQAQIRAATAAVEERIRQGALLEPATDSAMSRFREAQSIGGGDPLVRGSRDSLVAALLTAADKEVNAGRLAPARRLLDAAGTVNSSTPGLDIMRRRIDEKAGEQAAAEAARANAASATTNAASTQPAPASAAAPVQAQPAATSPAVPPPAATRPQQPAANSVVAASTLKILRRAEPEYPQQALERLVSGWVEMEFTVAKDGTVQDVVVVASEPRRTFDSAAMSAMRRYRFAQVLRDGQPVEQRASMRMRFAAQDSR
jgi:protein TonB